MPEIQRIREGNHECPLPGWGDNGEVVECSECGRRWKFNHPGNPRYAGWRLTLGSLFGRRYGVRRSD